MEIVKSDSLSFKGYSFKEWLDRNKKSIKDLLTGVLALITYLSTMSNPQWLQILLTLIIPVILRLGIDAVDYFLSDVVTIK